MSAGKVRRATAPTSRPPIQTIPLFVRADAHFTVYNDNGINYNYEKGDYKLTHLKWNEATHKFSWSGQKDWTLPESQLVTVIGK